MRESVVYKVGDRERVQKAVLAEKNRALIGRLNVELNNKFQMLYATPEGAVRRRNFIQDKIEKLCEKIGENRNSESILKYEAKIIKSMLSAKRSKEFSNHALLQKRLEEIEKLLKL